MLKTPFTQALLPKVIDFSCGCQPWEIEVSEWIKMPRGSGSLPGALDEMESQESCQVWLYGTEGGELVGFGSLGGTKWRWPRPNKDPQVSINVIPYLGISVEFQGKPERYAAQILSDLRAEACMHVEREPILGLFVDVRNQKAIRFYSKEGFVSFGKPITGTDTTLQRMMLDLRLKMANCRL